MARAKLANLYAEASGGFGPWVVARGRGGPVVRKRAVYRRPASPGQRAQAARLKEAAGFWSRLTGPETRAWNVYAKGIVRRNPVSARLYSPTGFNVFSGYVMTLLHLDPASPIPALPPETAFGGDEIWLSAVAVEGAVRFLAPAPNAPGVATELMLQPLANERRTPSKQYRSEGFVAFAPGDLTEDVPVAPGLYACATRFVEEATGRVAGMRRLGIVRVGPPPASTAEALPNRRYLPREDPPEPPASEPPPPPPTAAPKCQTPRPPRPRPPLPPRPDAPTRPPRLAQDPARYHARALILPRAPDPGEARRRAP